MKFLAAFTYCFISLVVCGTSLGAIYLRPTSDPTPCTLCLEMADEQWDCDSCLAVGCEVRRSEEIDKCRTFCNAPPDVVEEPQS